MMSKSNFNRFIYFSSFETLISTPCLLSGLEYTNII